MTTIQIQTTENMALETMKIYKGIKYYVNWINGNWHLILPELQKSIQVVDGCSTEDFEKIIEDEVIQFI